MRALAAPGTIAHMHEQLKPEMSEGIWLTHLPGGQIPPRQQLELPEATDPDSLVFYLEGHEFRAADVGHTDTYNTTVLHVPSPARGRGRRSLR